MSNSQNKTITPPATTPVELLNQAFATCLESFGGYSEEEASDQAEYLIDMVSEGGDETSQSLEALRDLIVGAVAVSNLLNRFAEEDAEDVEGVEEDNAPAQTQPQSEEDALRNDIRNIVAQAMNVDPESIKLIGDFVEGGPGFVGRGGAFPAYSTDTVKPPSIYDLFPGLRGAGNGKEAA